MSMNCRVRRLRVRAHDRAAVPTVSARLEDALRTASLPGFPANGVIYLKRLHLGRIAMSAPSCVIAKRIDEVLRNIKVVRGEAGQWAHGDHVAVWFASELEAYRALAGLIAHGHLPREWYWPAVVCGWSPQLPPDRGIVEILDQVSRMPTGLAGLAHVVRPMLGSDVLFNALNVIDGGLLVRWLERGGVAIDDGDGDGVCDDASPEPRAYHTLPVEWRTSLRRGATSWGPLDTRGLFLAALALATTRRRVTTGTAAGVIREAAAEPTATLGGEAPRVRPELGPAVPEPASEVGAVTESPASADRRRPAQREPGAVGEGEGEGPTPEFGYGLESPADRPSRRAIGDEPLAARSVESPAISMGDDPVDRAPVASPDLGAEPPVVSSELVGRRSDFGGFGFLVVAMQRLGFSAFLEACPEYRESDLALHVLFRAAELLRIPVDDSIRALHGDPRPSGGVPTTFVAPHAWRSIAGVTGSGAGRTRLARVEGATGTRLITDAGGRLVLAQWRPGHRSGVAPWLDVSAGLGASARPRSWTYESVVDNWILAIARYVRRVSGIKLRRVMSRPAKVAATETHIDVTLPLTSVDPQVRIGGLDIDPGWVPWVGRVVRFHYADGGRWAP